MCDSFFATRHVLVACGRHLARILLPCFQRFPFLFGAQFAVVTNFIWVFVMVFRMLNLSLRFGLVFLHYRVPYLLFVQFYNGYQGNAVPL